MNILIHLSADEKSEKLSRLEITDSGFSPWVTEHAYAGSRKEAKFWFDSLKREYPSLVEVGDNQIVFKAGFRTVLRKRLCEDLMEICGDGGDVSVWQLQERVKPTLSRPWIYEEEIEDEVSFLSGVIENQPYYCITVFELE